MTQWMRTLVLASGLLFASLAAAEPVNINSADADTIADSLKGVGPSKAAAIVAYREQNGPFRSVDDLLNVKGIGEKTLADNRTDILLK